MRGYLALAALLLAGLLVVGCSSSTTTAPTAASTSTTLATTTLAPTTTEASTTTSGGVTGDVTAGKALFETNCARCHGPNGHAGAGFEGVDLKDAVTDPTQETLGTINNGIPPNMPAWKDKLTAKEIGDIVAWIQAGLK